MWKVPVAIAVIIAASPGTMLPVITKRMKQAMVKASQKYMKMA